MQTKLPARVSGRHVAQGRQSFFWGVKAGTISAQNQDKLWTRNSTCTSREEICASRPPVTSGVVGVVPSEHRPPGHSSRERATALAALHAHMTAHETPSLASCGAQVCWLTSCLASLGGTPEPFQTNTHQPHNRGREPSSSRCVLLVRSGWLPCTDRLPPKAMTYFGHDPPRPRPTLATNQKMKNTKKETKNSEKQTLLPHAGWVLVSRCVRKKKRKKTCAENRSDLPTLFGLGWLTHFLLGRSLPTNITAFFSRISGSSPSSGPPKNSLFFLLQTFFACGIVATGRGHGPPKLCVWASLGSFCGSPGGEGEEGPGDGGPGEVGQRETNCAFELPGLILLDPSDRPPFWAPGPQHSGRQPLGHSHRSLHFCSFLFFFFVFLFIKVGSILLAKVGRGKKVAQESRDPPSTLAHLARTEPSRFKTETTVLTTMKRTRPSATVSSQRLSRALGWVGCARATNKAGENSKI